MANVFTKVFNFIKGLFVRAGLDQFLQAHIDLAVSTLAQLMAVNDNAGLHEWRDQAFASLKAQLRTDKDNWLVILIHLAYENLKARQATR